ncbi:hypothetical protein HID58_055279 [Brassica napus]|uniref:Uncharacterized protein n=1 Tax=Brassica napus TaxID=3708 RepID=A0ABQ8AK09_BRANA|nr:hypothetical protein HID58_055279 [Brassica napus]
MRLAESGDRLILYRYGVGSGENGEVVSDSDAGDVGSEMDSTAEGSSPGGDVGSSASQFPSRLFAVNSYPTALRLNIYSKENVIGAVAACLQGVPEATINKSRKRKVNKDNHGQSESQISGGKQIRSPIRRAKKNKTDG